MKERFRRAVPLFSVFFPAYDDAGECLRAPQPQLVRFNPGALEPVHGRDELSRTAVVYGGGDVYSGALRYGVQSDVEACVLDVCLDTVLDAGGVDRFLVPPAVEYKEAFTPAVYAFPGLEQETLFFRGVNLDYQVPA